MKSEIPSKDILSSSTRHQQDVILQILRDVAPLDFDVAGVDTAKRIAAGAAFRTVEGGRHLDLAGTIGLLSGIATLAQSLLLTGHWIKKRVEKAQRVREQEWDLLFRPIVEEAHQDQALQNLLDENPNLMREIAGAIDRFYRQDGEASAGEPHGEG